MDREETAEGQGGRRRRRLRPLWAALGLFGLGVLATWLSSRRIDPLEDWEELLEEDALPPRGRERFPSTPIEVAGPAGVLHVDDGGSGGIPVVFVHGLGGASDQWEPQLAHLRPHRRALAVDLRGHGRSAPAEDAAYGVEEFADDLGAVADDLGLERFVLAGHSMGASVAVELAAREPERVAGLLLVDANGDQTEIPRAELDEFLAALRADPAEEMRWYFRQVLVGAAPETAERVLADLEATPADVLVRSLESSFAYSPVAALERFRGPVLSVVSDMNTLPYSLHNLLPNLPVRLVAGTSHWLMLDRPEEVDRLLDELLARVG